MEMKQIVKITSNSSIPWISAGDRNLMPTKEDDEEFNKETFYQTLTSLDSSVDAYNQSKENSSGANTTWLGFSYDHVINHYDLEKKIFVSDERLDYILSNLICKSYFSLPVAFDPENSCLTDTITEVIDKGRYFASDHTLIGAHFVLE